jgi:hypothetical protein
VAPAGAPAGASAWLAAAINNPAHIVTIIVLRNIIVPSLGQVGGPANFAAGSTVRSRLRRASMQNSTRSDRYE